MPIEIVRNDITKVCADAIVNAANETLLGGGGVDGAIHRAAGPQLLEECRKLGGCKTGDAKITSGYALPCKYIIHTVGPVWHGGAYGEKEKLISCYKTSLRLACEYNCTSVAFPLISAGAYGYPKDQALRIATDTIRDFLMDHDLLVYLVVFDKTVFQVSSKLYAGIAQFIDDNYVAVHSDSVFEQSRRLQYSSFCKPCESKPMPRFEAERKARPQERLPRPSAERSLEDALGKLDESFAQMLFRKIDERGMTDTACYKRANLDRKLFSKIRSDQYYKPSKRTAVALAIALELSISETREFLMKAGFALSHSNKFDIIIEYFILHGKYDIHEINETLFYFDQVLLGA